MASTLHEFHRPADAEHAAAILQRTTVRTAPLVVGPRVPGERLAGLEAVVDLRQLGLDYVNETDDGVVHLGATASFQQLVDSVLLQSLASGIVAEAALLAGGSAMRHAATVSGAILHARQAAAEGPPELLIALLLLEAELVFKRATNSSVVLGLGHYLAGSGAVAAGDLLIEVRFARPGPAVHGALARVARTPRDQAIVAAGALVVGGAVRLAVAAGGVAPQRLTTVEQGLAGQEATEAQLEAVARETAAAVAPAGDFRASAEYRRAMAGVLTRRALSEASGRASQEQP